MNTVLLDTNIVSFLFKKDSRAKAYVPHLQGKRQMISFVTVAELYQWATHNPSDFEAVSGLEIITTVR